MNAVPALLPAETIELVKSRIDYSAVNRMDVRMRIANHEAERKAITDEIDRIEAPFRAQMEAATKELHEKLDAHDEAPNMYTAARDFDDEPHRCCISGLIILEDDPVVFLEGDEDGRMALAAVIGWPDPDDEIPAAQPDAGDDGYAPITSTSGKAA